MFIGALMSFDTMHSVILRLLYIMVFMNFDFPGEACAVDQPGV